MAKLRRHIEYKTVLDTYVKRDYIVGVTIRLKDEHLAGV